MSAFPGRIKLYYIKELQPLKSAIFILVFDPAVFILLPVQELFLVWFGWLVFVFLVVSKPRWSLTHIFHTDRGTDSRRIPASPKLSAAILYLGMYCAPRRRVRGTSQKLTDKSF